MLYTFYENFFSHYNQLKYELNYHFVVVFLCLIMNVFLIHQGILKTTTDFNPSVLIINKYYNFTRHNKDR